MYLNWKMVNFEISLIFSFFILNNQLIKINSRFGSLYYIIKDQIFLVQFKET